MAKILLVEDDNNLREIYQARMQAEGYEVVTASDGEAALALAAKEKPDLIISDVMMPKISGFEMLDILRNTEGLKTTKVIMLTALGQAEDKTRADSLGADKYLVKSQVTLEDIVNTARSLLNDEASATPAAQAAPTQPAAPTPATPAPIGTPTPQQPVSAPTPPPAAAPAEPAVAQPAQSTTMPAPTPAVSAPSSPPTSEPAVATIPVATPPAAQPPAPQSQPAAATPTTPTAPEPTTTTAGGTQAPTQPAAPAPQAPAANSAAAPAPNAPAASAAAIDDKVVSNAIEQLIADADKSFAEAQTPAERTTSPAPKRQTILPSQPAPSGDNIRPATPPEQTQAASDTSDNVTVVGKKVIRPPEHTDDKPSLDELLAKEPDADMPSAPAAPGATINQTTSATSPQPGASFQPQNNPSNPGGGFDPNSISL